jgi:hypothetical protein
MRLPVVVSRRELLIRRTSTVVLGTVKMRDELTRRGVNTGKNGITGITVIIGNL